MAAAVEAIPAANAMREWATYESAYETNQFASNINCSVEIANKAIRQRNNRIFAALRPLTGLDLGDEPMKWWKWWWQDYNEMYNVSSRGESGPSDQPYKPVYAYNYNYQ
jgi:hypothetical protein